MKLCWSHFLVVLLLMQTSLPVSAEYSMANPNQAVTLILSGRQVELSLPFATADFTQPAPDDAQQVATAVVWAPFFEVSLEAQPASPGNSNAAKHSLQTLRAGQAGTALPGRQISFFDQTVNSISNQVKLALRASMKEPVVVHEWVVWAYERSWTFRVSFTPGQGFDESLLEQIVITSSELAPEYTLPNQAQAVEMLDSSTALLPVPAWWQGDCDTTYYYSKSGLNAYPLGGSYRGVKACGPRPWYDGAPDVLVRFFTGAWGEYEWECVELSMRFLYLAYGVAPYPGNGKDVVANYTGTLLMKVNNGTASKAPQPGDVLSYGPTTTYGHTSVVSASSVDTNGNGSITVIEQNSSATGIKTHTVTNWVVLASSTVSGWLHLPDQTVEMPFTVFIPVVIGP